MDQYIVAAWYEVSEGCDLALGSFCDAGMPWQAYAQTVVLFGLICALTF